MNKSFFHRILSIVLSFALIQSQIALANPKALEGILSPERQTIYIDPSPSSKGKKVYSIIPAQEGKEAQVRRGVIENGKVKWSDGLVSEATSKKAADSLRPTRVAQTQWDEKRRASMRSLTERLKRGDRTLFQEMSEQSSRNLEANRATHSKTAGMTQLGISFYLAMGVLAYFELSTNYANNPNAWSDFADSLNDPIGWLMLPAFILASHKVFKRAQAMKGLKAFGMTSVGMALGLITTTVLGKMLNDPNFRHCAGFTSYDKNGRFEFNHTACDQLFDAWAGEELFLTIVPIIGHAVMAGGMVASLLWFAKLGLNATQLAEKIRVGASFLKRPKAGGLISIASGIGGMVLFFGAFQLSYAIVDIESSLRDFFLTTFNPFHDPQGSSLRVNLDKMNRAFQAELKNGFTEATDFDEVLAQHLELMTKWRTHKFSKVNQAYQAWSIRSDGFADMATAAYLNYRDFLTDLTRHRQGEIDMMSATRKENLRLNANQSEALAFSDLDYEGIFKHVYIRNHFDFLLTSMACGPDTGEVDTKEGFFAGLKSMVMDDPTPKIMVTNEKGQKAMFYPPRLVDPDQFNICSIHPMKAMRSGYKILDTLRDYTPEPPFMSSSLPLPPEKIYGVVGEQKFMGALDYLIKAIPEELAPHEGESRFESWWLSEVIPSLSVVNEQIAEEYSEFINTTYREVLGSESVRCDHREDFVSFNGIGPLLKEAQVNNSCQDTDNYRLGEGLSNSAHEQIALYFNLILQISKATRIDQTQMKSLMTSYLYKFHKLSEALALKTSLNGFEELGILATDFIETEEQLFNLLSEISANPSQGTERARQLIGSLNLAAKTVLGEALQFQEPLMGVGVLAAIPN